eukprot:TRINITY_DN44547_c0_g1_i1.p1 TRINITY_DN44547_c0_g1~~TRINITY_DN44547_c0_g1_i1.p1  ORF type:complete len:580 (-),score=108.50 TRINITY_DN44547_c0_g1_i1:196-1935(-)
MEALFHGEAGGAAAAGASSSSAAAGAAARSFRFPGSVRPSPAARPSDLNWSFRGPSPATEARSASPPINGGSPPRVQGWMHAVGKQESHRAFRSFGVQPDIDFTFKRRSGDCSPTRPGESGSPPPQSQPAASSRSHGQRSSYSDQREALKAFGSMGVGPGVDCIERRGRGSCSPLREGFRHQQQNDYMFGVCDINEISRLRVGQCSPRLDGSELAANRSFAWPAAKDGDVSNFVSREVNLKSFRQSFRKSRSCDELDTAGLTDLECRSASPSQPRTRRRATSSDLEPRTQLGDGAPSWLALPFAAKAETRRRQPMSVGAHLSAARLQAGASPGRANARAGHTMSELAQDATNAPIYVQPTESSRARFTRDLSAMKGSELHALNALNDRLRKAPANHPQLKLLSRKGKEKAEVARDARSEAASSAKPTGSSAASSSQCVASYKLAAKRSQLSKSERSVWSTSTTSTGYPQSHQSFKVASSGEILAELRANKEVPRRPRQEATGKHTPAALKRAASPAREKPSSTTGPKLPGAILAEFRTPVWVRDFLEVPVSAVSAARGIAVEVEVEVLSAATASPAAEE